MLPCPWAGRGTQCAGVITVFVSACLCLRVQRAGKELHSCLILCIQSGLLCSDLRVCVHVCGCACAGACRLQSRVWSANTWGSPLDTVRLYWCLNTRLQARERAGVLRDLRLSVDAVTTWENIKYCLLGKVLCFNLSDTSCHTKVARNFICHIFSDFCDWSPFFFFLCICCLFKMGLVFPQGNPS